MTEQKAKLVNFGTTYIGIPLAMIITMALLGGRKLEAIDVIQQRLDTVTLKVELLEQTLPIITTKLENIQCDMTSIKMDLKDIAKNQRYYQYNTQEYNK